MKASSTMAPERSSESGVKRATGRAHLPNAKAAEKMKAYWRERLTALKKVLEEAK